jgi:hypothetical protein
MYGHKEDHELADSTTLEVQPMTNAMESKKRDESKDRWVVHADAGESVLQVAPRNCPFPVTHCVPLSELDSTRDLLVRYKQMATDACIEMALARRRMQEAQSELAVLDCILGTNALDSGGQFKRLYDALITAQKELSVERNENLVAYQAFTEGFQVAVVEIKSGCCPARDCSQAKERGLYPESQDARIDWDRGYDEAIACYRMRFSLQSLEIMDGIPITTAAALDEFGDKSLLLPDPRDHQTDT